MSKKHVVTVALAITATLFITACGLQGDLYIPEEQAASEETTAAPAGDQGTDNETAEDEKSNQSSEQAP